MLHDVTIRIFNPGGGMERQIVTVDASGGDDAAERGAVEAVALAGGRAWHIVAVAPVEQPLVDYMAPEAAMEGAEADEEASEPAKRGPGRPRKVIEPT